MRKVIVLALVLFSIKCFAFDKNSIEYVKNSAFSIDGNKTFKYISEDLYGLSYEVQTAFTYLISGKSLNSYYLFNNGFYSSLCIGPQINLFNNAIEGLLIGTYPGFSVEFNDSEGTWKAIWLCEASFNTIIENILLGISVSKDLFQINETEITFKVGYCFSNSKYKLIKNQ